MSARPLLAALAAALTLPAVAHAAPETLWLDAHDAVANEQPTVVAKTHLLAGHAYSVTVEGTFSIVPAARWRVPSVCGTPAPRPRFPSPGVENGKVGADAEVQLARTTDNGCSGHYPRPHNRFQIDVGNGFRHLPAAGEPFGDVAPSDRYTYRVAGTGAAARFRIFDKPATDNYGMLRIVVTDTTGEPQPQPLPRVARPRCVERRAFTLRLRRGVRHATVTVAGRRVPVHYGRRATARIDFHGTRRARLRVRVVLVTASGHRRVHVRTYRTCARWAPRGT
jgi:hypothetical protein